MFACEQCMHQMQSTSCPVPMRSIFAEMDRMWLASGACTPHKQISEAQQMQRRVNAFTQYLETIDNIFSPASFQAARCF